MSISKKVKEASEQYEGLEDASADYVEMYYTSFNEELKKAFIAGVNYKQKEIVKLKKYIQSLNLHIKKIKHELQH